MIFEFVHGASQEEFFRGKSKRHLDQRVPLAVNFVVEFHACRGGGIRILQHMMIGQQQMR